MDATSKKIPSKKWVGNTFSMSIALGSSAISVSYLSYAFTDLAKIPLGPTGIINFIGTALGIVMSFTIGMAMTKTISRFGQCRPYLFFGYIATTLGCFVLYSSGLFNGEIARIAAATIGLVVMMMANSVRIAAMYGLERIVAGSDYEAKTLMSSRGNIGISGGLMLEGLIILPIANFFGGGIKGFMCMELVVSVIGIIAMWYLFHVTKGYDLPDKIQVEEAPTEHVSIMDMLKSVVVNRAALSLFISDTVRLFGYCIWFALIVYQCKYVIGDMNSMVIVLTMTNIVGVIGSYLSFWFAKLLNGRKRMACAVCIFVVLSLLGVGIFGDTLWGFVIFSCLGCFFMSFYDSVSPMLYADAGEYWLYKTGKDTRTYLTTIAGMPLNIAMALSSFGFAAVLMIINYVPDQEMTAQAANTLTWSVGLVPAICYIIPLILLAFVHGVSDAKVQSYSIENEKKYGAAPLE